MKKRIYLQQKKWMRRAINRYRGNSVVRECVEDDILWLNNAYKGKKLGRYYSDYLKEAKWRN